MSNDATLRRQIIAFIKDWNFAVVPDSLIIASDGYPIPKGYDWLTALKMFCFMAPRPLPRRYFEYLARLSNWLASQEII